uniref:Uncharacterized protein n=1 Tax=Cacopsylla melanoneura TaxID=428564 RepID=A0A8D8XCJ2_9HEMI
MDRKRRRWCMKKRKMERLKREEQERTSKNRKMVKNMKTRLKMVKTTTRFKSQQCTNPLHMQLNRLPLVYRLLTLRRQQSWSLTNHRLQSNHQETETHSPPPRRQCPTLRHVAKRNQPCPARPPRQLPFPWLRRGPRC